MHHTLSPTRSLPERVLDVLVVANEAPARARLASQIWHALPSARVHELAQLNDLVYRVAGSGVHLVVLAAEPLQPLPLTPLLVQMLKGIQPAVRIVCVAPAEPAPMPSTDASLTEASFPGWLRSMYGSGGASLAAHPSPAVRL